MLLVKRNPADGSSPWILEYKAPPMQGLHSFYATLNLQTWTATIDWIDVAKTKRRSGVGTKAVLAFEAWARDHGAKQITGHAVPLALSFWESLGYRASKKMTRLHGSETGAKGYAVRKALP